MTAILATSTRGHIAQYVAALVFVYSLAIIAYILSSMYFAVGGRLPYSRASTAIIGFLRDVSEPFLGVFRRFVPQFGMIDLSPLLALITLAIGGKLLVSLIAG